MLQSWQSFDMQKDKVLPSPEDIRRGYGRRLRRWRRAYPSLTKEEVAARAGKSVSTVHRWEMGSSEPTTTDLGQLERLKPGLVRMLFPGAFRQSC